jgi:hypothetical protein
LLVGLLLNQEALFESRAPSELLASFECESIFLEYWFKFLVAIVNGV